MSFDCPECGKGTMKLTLIPLLTRKVGGSRRLLPNAHIFKCDSCRKISFPAAEARRFLPKIEPVDLAKTAQN